MSSCLWFSHRVWPSQLHSHPTRPPVLSFLNSRTHWGQHLACAKSPHSVRSARVCACTALSCSFIPANQKSPMSESPRWLAGANSKLASASHQPVTSRLGGGLMAPPAEMSHFLCGIDGAAAAQAVMWRL